MRMALRTRAARKVAAVVTIPLVLAPFALAYPAAALPAQAAANVDALPENKFAPETLTVPVGATVTWTNKGGFHTVQGGDGVDDPNSPIGVNQLATDGATVQVTFPAEGSFPYFCLPHVGSGMKGVIVVAAAGAPAPAGAASGSAGASATGSALGGSAAPAGSPGAAGGAGPAGAPAGDAAAGTAAVQSQTASQTASPSAPGEPDDNVGRSARDILEQKLADESKPLTSFRLALWAITFGVLVLSAGVYFITKPPRDEA